jgi:hypothetical protein
MIRAAGILGKPQNDGLRSEVPQQPALLDYLERIAIALENANPLDPTPVAVDELKIPITGTGQARRRDRGRVLDSGPTGVRLRCLPTAPSGDDQQAVSGTDLVARQGTGDPDHRRQPGAGGGGGSSIPGQLGY